MISKIPCGGFYYDVSKLSFIKGENGRVYLTIPDNVLTGIKGDKGDKGDPFTITKIYESYDAMVTDHDNPNIEMNSFVLIESGTDDGVDNGKLYIKDTNGFDYITNLTGAQGIKGDKGDTGSGVPSGGTTGQFLAKTTDHDFATHWETLEYGEIIHAENSVQVLDFYVPTLTEQQAISAYNSFIAGKSVVISSANGKKHYTVTTVGGDGDNITVTILYENSLIVTYNKFGAVANYVPIYDGEVVEYSREYATAPNDHGYVREWTLNKQGKQWAECGVFVTTAALSVGSNVPLPITFEDGNFHVQATVMEQGNYFVCVYPSGNNHSVNVRVSDPYGTPKSVKVCVEAKGWMDVV